MAGRTILEIAYGIEVQPRNDPYINIVEKAVEAMTFGNTQRARVFDTFLICTASFYFICGLFLTYTAHMQWRACPNISLACPSKEKRGSGLHNAH